MCFANFASFNYSVFALFLIDLDTFVVYSLELMDFFQSSFFFFGGVDLSLTKGKKRMNALSKLGIFSKCDCCIECKRQN